MRTHDPFYNPSVLRIKRVYEQPAKDYGYRVLVDRLWPRGLKKEHAHVDLWLKDIAPSDALRKWFAHDPAKWTAFRKKYARELADKADAVHELKRVIRAEKIVTLVYGAKDEEHNQAVALMEVLKRRSKQ